MPDTFTIEQIKAAFYQHHRYDINNVTNPEWDDFIAELTKSVWTPGVEELVHYDSPSQIGYCLYSKGWMDNAKLRPLNSSEVPALKVAIARIETNKKNLSYWVKDSGIAQRWLNTFEGEIKHIDSTLAKIKELTQSNGVE